MVHGGCDVGVVEASGLGQDGVGARVPCQPDQSPFFNKPKIHPTTIARKDFPAVQNLAAHDTFRRTGP